MDVNGSSALLAFAYRIRGASLPVLLIVLLGLLAFLAIDPAKNLALLRVYALKTVRPGIVIVLSAAAAYYAYKSIHWQLMVDSPIMHYVNFLIDHGREPYTDITDNNMPGAYYTESLAMLVFGAGDVGWRIYDYFLLATLIAGLVAIARPYDWLAGVFAGGLFIAVHAAEGPKYSVEREQVLTVLLVLGYAAMFAGVRRRRPALMAIFGVVSGLSASIKPTFLPLSLVLAAMLVFVLWRRKISIWPYLVWASAGFVMVMALDFAFLVRHHAVHGFVFVLTTVTPVYAALARMSFWHLLTLSLPEYIPVLLLLTVVAGVLNRRCRGPWTWEQWALAAGAAFGLMSFMAQGKPFWHHRYTLLVFLFLLMGFELLHALRQRSKWTQGVALLAIAFTLLWVVPREMRSVLHVARQMPAGQTLFTLNLESDLQRLGPADLQNKVQCFDLVYGCLGALYRLGIVENTSYTGDLLLFTPSDGPVNEYYKNKYWDLEHRDPGSVIVMSNEWFQQKNSFDKVKLWPAFDDFLHRNYTLALERFAIGQGDDPNNPDGYRIYIRNGSPLLERGLALRKPHAM